MRWTVGPQPYRHTKSVDRYIEQYQVRKHLSRSGEDSLTQAMCSGTTPALDGCRIALPFRIEGDF